MSFLLGIDSSTTATKAVLVDQSGATVGVGASEYGYETPQPLWSEQDADLWWEATKAAIPAALEDAGASGADVSAVGLTGQMHGLTLLDEHDRPLRRAILWNDQRSGAECDEIRDRVGFDRLIEITGNDALTGFTASKLMWVRNHEPDVFAAARAMLLPKDYVRLRLTGQKAVDRAGGAGTQLFDLAERTWSDELLGTLELDRSLFPDTFEGTAVTGQVTSDAAAATGLVAGTPVVGGAGDQAASAVGTGAVAEGIVSLSVGTSGVVFSPLAAMRVEPQGRLHAFCHALPGQWHFMGVMLSAAGSLRWFRDVFLPDSSFDEVAGQAATANPGSDGLVFLPYLTGERTPHPDPQARGAFVGLTVRHGMAEMARAVLEGVAFGLRDAFELIKDSGVEVGQVRATGGGVASDLWRQIISDALGEPLHTVENPEGAAAGAATLAAEAAGWTDDASALAAAWAQATPSASPTADWDIDAAYERYRQLYPALHQR